MTLSLLAYRNKTSAFERNRMNPVTYQGSGKLASILRRCIHTFVTNGACLMRLLPALSTLVFAFLAVPAFAQAETAAPNGAAAAAQEEIELPEIIIKMPAAEFLPAIVEDNVPPIVLLLV
jgi:hypothetical protein